MAAVVVTAQRRVPIADPAVPDHPSLSTYKMGLDQLSEPLPTILFFPR
jgi:hypothetical protein